MPHWMIKAALQGALSRLPEPQRWNRLFQRYVTKSLDLTDEYFLEKWQQCERHLENFRKHHASAGGFTALELGTGWMPITPVGLALGGARRVYTLDMQSLVRKPQVLAVLRAYQTHLRRGTISMADPLAMERLSELVARARQLSVREMLAALGIETLVADARRAPLADQSVDLFLSNNTLEHIPGEVIGDIFREFRRMASSGAIMSHFIDMTDHYTTFDSSISVYNFLQFSERRWSLFNNELQYQNRLRLPDFRELHQKTGWVVEEEDNYAEPPEALHGLELAEEFAHYDEAELRVYASWMVSRRPNESSPDRTA